VGMALMTPAHRRSARRAGMRPSPAAGFSLPEVLIAVLVFFFIVIGIAPLFTRAALSNASGADSTQISQFSRSQVEQLYQAPFDVPALTIPAGSQSREMVEYWDATHNRFTPVPPASGEVSRWTRWTRIRQFNIADFDDGVLTDDEALDGNADPSNVHLKEIEVEVESNRALLLGGRHLIVKTLKSF
jgi:hypothetical protein